MQNLRTYFVTKMINVFAISYDRNFNVTLSNDFVSFEQQGSGILEIVDDINASPFISIFFPLASL